MIAFAILGTGFAPHCVRDRAAPAVDGALFATELPEAPARPGREAARPSDDQAETPASPGDADVPDDGDGGSFDHATGSVFLMGRRANLRPSFVPVRPHRTLALAPRRSPVSSPSAPPRATDLPTTLCRWTC